MQAPVPQRHQSHTNSNNRHNQSVCLGSSNSECRVGGRSAFNIPNQNSPFSPLYFVLGFSAASLVAAMALLA